VLDLGLSGSSSAGSGEPRPFDPFSGSSSAGSGEPRPFDPFSGSSSAGSGEPRPFDPPTDTGHDARLVPRQSLRSPQGGLGTVNRSMTATSLAELAGKLLAHFLYKPLHIAMRQTKDHVG